MLDDFGLPKGPNADFWFGADQSGRDVFVRVLYGARTSLLVAIVATGVAVVIGTVLGLISGYFRGFTDTVISRCIDVILALPLLLFAIGIVAACGTSKEGCIGGLDRSPVSGSSSSSSRSSAGRTSRASCAATCCRSARRSTSRRHARSAPGNFRIMFKRGPAEPDRPDHRLHDAAHPGQHPLRGSACRSSGSAFPASTPSWGQMLSDASAIFDVAWWLMLFPGLFLIATTLSFNLLGDGLRDALDPRTDR